MSFSYFFTILSPHIFASCPLLLWGSISETVEFRGKILWTHEPSFTKMVDGFKSNRETYPKQTEKMHMNREFLGSFNKQTTTHKTELSSFDYVNQERL